jgi:hypothetical protein
MSQTVDAVKSAGTSILRNARDKGQEMALGRHTSGLADLFTAPNSADLIAAIRERGVEPVYANALLRQALQAPGQANGR